jgi:ubiquitin-activating enzyme E1
MLKNWAMMGISCPSQTGSRGVTYVTDMDQIERSNLSRQFLFRNTNIGHLKSDTAVNAVKAMNPAFQALAYDKKVGSETEAFFGDDFFDSLDIVCAALDNVDARLYLDQRCLLYHKPMFESGTLGAKGHTQVVLPRFTEHYGASRDPPEKSIPLCTLKSFPNRIEHTLQWAREYFEEIYKQTPENVNRYIADTNEFVAYLQSQSNAKLDILQKVKQALEQRPLSYTDCLAWARIQFEDLYNNNIQQLLYNLPLDKVGADGTPFWSGAKLPPSAVRFDPADPLHLEYVTALADMRAHVYRVPTQALSAAQLSSVLVSVSVPVFK